MKDNTKKWMLAVFGGAVGAINGFLGGGGGILVVTVLLWLNKLPQKNAQATALWVILPVSVVSAIIYLLNGNGDWTKILYSTLGVVIGGCLGAMLLNKLQGNTIKLIFSIILILGAVRMFL